MKWHVKVYLSPIVQEEPEEFLISDLAYFNAEMLQRAIPLHFVREIKLLKVKDETQK